MSGNFLGRRTVEDIWANFDTQPREPQYLKFGIPEIDQALNGGLVQGKITEIYGHSGSGKTQFALSLASEILVGNLIHSRDWVVLYLYTNGNFPIHRLTEIMTAKYNDCKHLVKTEGDFKVTELLANIYLYKVVDNDELHFVLTSKLESMLKYKVKLIVIDSIAPIFRIVSNEGYFDPGVNTILKIATLLKRIAHQYNLLVLAINQASGALDNNGMPFLNQKSAIKPALGDPWQRSINSRILVSRNRDDRFKEEIRHFQVIFSPEAPTSHQIPFITTSRGIEYNEL